MFDFDATKGEMKMSDQHTRQKKDSKRIMENAMRESSGGRDSCLAIKSRLGTSMKATKATMSG